MADVLPAVPDWPLAEVYEYFSNAQEEVRLAATKIVAGVSAEINTEMLKHISIHPERSAKPLVTLLHDQPRISAVAWDALTNFSASSQDICAYMLGHHLRVITDTICAPNSIFADAASMLLCNLTKHPNASTHVNTLLPVLVRMLRIDPTHNALCSFDYCMSAIADISIFPEGRKYLLDGIETGSDLLTAVLIPELQGEYHQANNNRACVRRGGAAAAIKNCLFDVERHGAVLDREERCEADGSLFIIAALASRLFTEESNLTTEELDALPIELQLLKRSSEPDSGIRAIILESFVLLGTTRRGRDCMRRKAIYPVLREWHRIEPEESLRGLVERIVELLIRDEAPDVSQ